MQAPKIHDNIFWQAQKKKGARIIPDFCPNYTQLLAEIRPIFAWILTFAKLGEGGGGTRTPMIVIIIVHVSFNYTQANTIVTQKE